MITMLEMKGCSINTIVGIAISVIDTRIDPIAYINIVCVILKEVNVTL